MKKLNQINLFNFINKQVEIAVNIELVRMAEKFISEKQMNFEMQYAIDLLQQALLGFEKIRTSEENPSRNVALLESGDLCRSEQGDS